MRKINFSIILLVVVLCGCQSKNETTISSDINIIPQPVKLEKQPGSFEITNETVINVIGKDKQVLSVANYFNTVFNGISGYKLKINKLQQASEKANSISLEITNDTIKKEGYNLHVSKKGVQIKASEASGLFYGIQTLRQLLPPFTTIENKDESTKWLIPAVEVKDSPRFSWRAFMLDEARYFHGETFVKSLLDEMALLKMNIFHWHLVDDAGWRVEIKKYPKLTEIGSKRADTEIETWKSGKLAGEPHSGFYTQEQIKDIVAYAAERNITIVPEFEMPGHSSAAIASYPWLGTLGKKMDVPVLFGRHYDNYDVTKPEVIQFIEDVLTELFELFPSKVIHIGGDEVDYTVWNETNHVQKYMKEKGLKTPADLQIYFTNNISKFIESKGRRMMGWNEIMGKNIHKDFEEKKDDLEAESSLAKNAVVHFWKGDIELITKAAEDGYGIVNSANEHTYLDYDYEKISLNRSYNFDPIPTALDKKYHDNIYGFGCQMWSEWTPTNDAVEYQTFPRIAAYAEVGWTATTKKDFQSFTKRLKKLQERWDKKKINYAKPVD